LSRDSQEIGDNVAHDDAIWINVSVFFQEPVEILELLKRLWYAQQRPVLSAEQSAAARQIDTVHPLFKCRQCKPESCTENKRTENEYTGHLEDGIEDEFARVWTGGVGGGSSTVRGGCGGNKRLYIVERVGGRVVS